MFYETAEKEHSLLPSPRKLVYIAHNPGNNGIDAHLDKSGGSEPGNDDGQCLKFQPNGEPSMAIANVATRQCMVEDSQYRGQWYWGRIELTVSIIL